MTFDHACFCEYSTPISRLLATRRQLEAAIFNMAKTAILLGYNDHPLNKTDECSIAGSGKLMPELGDPILS